MEVNLLKVVLLALALSLSCKVIASPTTYLPIGADTHLELQIERLFALTQGNPMRKPYAIKEIEVALEQIKQTNPGLYQFISHRLDVYHGLKKTCQYFFCFDNHQSKHLIEYLGSYGLKPLKKRPDRYNHPVPNGTYKVVLDSLKMIKPVNLVVRQMLDWCA